MNTPGTPFKEHREVSDILLGLNIKWGLDLPIRKAPESPAKSKRPGRPEPKIASKIKYLFYKDKISLQKALEKFDHHAATIRTSWKFKPYGDADVLPCSPAGRNVVPLPATRSTTEIPALLDCLGRFLDEIVPPQSPVVSLIDSLQYLQTNPLRPQLTGVTDDSTNLSYDGDFLVSRKASTTSLPYLGQGERPVFPTKQSQSQSQTTEVFDSWNTQADQAMLDLMAEEPTTPLTESGTEGFRTPPEQLQDHGTMQSMDDQYFSPKVENIPTTTGKKRRSNEENENSSSKKLSRGSFAVSSYQAVQVVNPIKVPETLTRNSQSISATTSFASNTSNVFSIAPGTTTARTSFVSDGNVDNMAKQGNPQSNQALRRTSSTSPNETTDDEPLPDTREARIKGYSRTVGGMPIEKYFKSYLHGDNSPLVEESGKVHAELEWRLQYEITRVALHCGVPPLDLLQGMHANRTLDKTDLGDLYSHLRKYMSRSDRDVESQNSGARLPVRSSAIAWQEARETPTAVVSNDQVSFSGDLSFADRPGEPMFKLQLKPLKLDKQYRLARKFGSHRILTVGLPNLAPGALPTYLKNSSSLVRDHIVDWLMNGSHTILGRVWKVFYVTPQEVRKENRGKLNSINHLIWFFAIDGEGFVPSQFGSVNKPPVSTSLAEMVKWFMPLNLNLHQPALKLFARLKLAISGTVKALEFQTWQILRCDDMLSGVDTKVRINTQRSEEKKNGAPSTSKLVPSLDVMNDGCSRISLQAAKHVKAALGLDYLPSAFQGRIGGAKGLWMVDFTNESLPCNTSEFLDEDIAAEKDPRVWIEITDSQLKFDCDTTGPTSTNWPDPLRKTFEVNACSGPLKPAALNLQLLVVLAEQGVPRDVFETLLRTHLISKTSRLKAAMYDPVELRVWNQETSPVASSRIRAGGIEYTGGLPDDTSEQINMLLEHGFEPQSCKLLNELCFDVIHAYKKSLSERLHIEVGRSTYALMLADPLCVLEEGEVHFGFSNSFVDPNSDWSETMLDNADLLVARVPANLPSDVQKVRAVFKRDLAKYKDVIIFSVKGKTPLAAKLSGGDYDGDRAWVCWEPSMVDNFHGAELSPSPSFSEYGITKDSQKVRDIVRSFSGKEHEENVKEFITHGVSFSLQPAMLGRLTTYHQSYVYHLHKVYGDGQRINRELPVKIAHLLSYLVDTSKNGYKFDDATWNSFRKKHSELRLRYPIPAFRAESSEEPNFLHVLDYLAIKVTKKVVDEELGDFKTRFSKDAFSFDADLTSVYNEEYEFARSHGGVNSDLLVVFTGLKTQFEDVYKRWQQLARQMEELKGNVKGEEKSRVWVTGVEDLRASFLELRPPSDVGAGLLRWGSSSGVSKMKKLSLTNRNWELLKASYLFTLYYKGGSKFVWWICGKELCEIKALQVPSKPSHEGPRTDSVRFMVKALHNVFRPDARMVKRISEAKEVAEEEDDSYLIEGEYDGSSNGDFRLSKDTGYF